jgi:hypothetical protein
MPQREWFGRGAQQVYLPVVSSYWHDPLQHSPPQYALLPIGPAVHRLNVSGLMPIGAAAVGAASDAQQEEDTAHPLRAVADRDELPALHVIHTG